jgi:hypothetical protein
MYKTYKMVSKNSPKIAQNQSSTSALYSHKKALNPLANNAKLTKAQLLAMMRRKTKSQLLALLGNPLPPRNNRLRRCEKQ